MKKIILPRGEWNYDPAQPLGKPGGFGAVYAGNGKGYSNIAVKEIIDLTDKVARRELTIVDELIGKSYQHVIPILDAGKDTTSGKYYVVMERADKSLQDHIGAMNSFNAAEAANILLEIAEGLSEVSSIVHRDLKPGNVLLQSNSWKVADFGIARFVEESTSLQTVKGYLSPSYAAPEQWEIEHATNATDIYALGCIGYSLLTGTAPFPGPNIADYKFQHLNSSPPSLSNGAPELRSLLLTMLRKRKETRPNIQRVIQTLRDVIVKGNQSNSPFGLLALAQAGVAEAERESKAKADEQARQSTNITREKIASEATRILRSNMELLFKHISAAAPTGNFSINTVAYDNAVMQVSYFIGAIPVGAFSMSKWDVVTGATIKLVQNRPDYQWSSSMWYSKTNPDDDYRWREVAYFHQPLLRSRSPFAPFALSDINGADGAASSSMNTYTIAWGPKTIDDENLDDFIHRWALLLAKAIQGTLCHPSSLPLAPDFYLHPF